MDLQKEREAFELNVSPVTWERIEYNAENNIYMAKSKYWTSTIVQAVANEIDFGWKMWQLAKAQTVPEGFILMPKVPTERMVNATRGKHEGAPYLPYSIYEAFVEQAMIEALEQSHD